MSVDVSKLGYERSDPLGLIALLKSVTSRTALATSLGHSVTDLYNNSGPVILRQHLGLRQQYKWGLHGYCAYSKTPNSSRMGCEGGAFDTMVVPIDAILGDIPDSYLSNVTTLISSSAFTDSRYLLNTIRPASIFVFIGMLSLACTLLCGIVKSPLTFLFATICNLCSVLSLVIGISIWTVLVQQVREVNSAHVLGTPLGIEVQRGSGILLMWAAVIPVILALPLYMVPCMTYRG